MPTDEEEDADRIDALRSALELPFYLYEGPSFDDGSWFEACSRGLRGERIEEDQYSGEHYWLAQLRRHRWRVAQPSAALLFVVPLYLNAALQPSVKGASCNGTHFQVLLDATAAAVAATEQYARHDGADHVIVSNSWKLTQTPPEQAPWSKVGQLPNELFRRTFRNAIVGHMESHGLAKPPSSAFWRCSVVSPYVANYDEAAAAHRRPPASKERDVSFYFQGGANNRGTRGYAFRQAALPQLQDLPAAHISAFSLPGKPAACGGAVSTNCRAGRSSGAFRSLMARSRFNLVLRGDSPSSRRLFDGVAAGALSVLISDELWSVGLPFPCLVPWRKIAFTIAERPFLSSTGAAAVVGALDKLSPASLGRTQRLANRFRRDLIWNTNGSRVAENLLITAALRCLPAHVVRRAAARAAALAAALRALRQHCPHGDTSLACVAPDASNCAGCETGDLASATPIEHCCADSCPQCRGLPARNRSSAPRAANRSASRAAARCVPADVYYGEPMRHDASRRGAIAAYLAQADKDAPEALQRWRKLAGQARPGSGGGSAGGRGRLKARGDEASGLKPRGRGAAAGSSRRPLST